MKNLWKNERLYIPALLALLLATAFYDVVIGGKTFKVTTANSQALPTGAYGQENNKPRFIPVNGTDSPVLEEPAYEFVKQNLRRGILPLWNPHQAAGYPFIGMIQMGIFYPLNFILYLFPQLYAWDLLILARMLTAGLLTFWFMRSLRFAILPALGAAIAFMLSGPLVLLQYWTANIDILTPLILLCLDRLIRAPNRRNIAVTAAATALTVLGGHPEHIFLVNAFGFAFLVFRAISLRRTVEIKRVGLALLSAYLLAAGLSALVTFPFFRYLVFDLWHGHPDRVGLLLEEHPERAITLILPHFFQREAVTYSWVFAGWWGGYIGLIPFALAFTSLFNRHRRGMNYFFAAMAFLIISKEYALPYINWLGYLPIFNTCRFASHTPSLAAFSIAICAGMGIRSILNSRHQFLKALPFTVIVLLIINIHLIILRQAEHLALSLRASAWALALLLALQGLLLSKDKRVLGRAAVGVLLVALLFLELFSYIHRERPRRFDSFGTVPYIEFLKDRPDRVRSYGSFWAFYPNTATGFEVDDLGFFLGLVPKRFVLLVNGAIIPNHFRNDLRPPALRAIPIQNREALLDLLNVRYLIRPASRDFERHFAHFKDVPQNEQLVYNQEVRIFERTTAYPRAFVVHRAIFEPNRQQAMAMLNALGPRSRYVAILNHPPVPPILDRLKDTPAADSSRVHIQSYSANQVIIDATLDHDGLLVFSDAYHPDWQAAVDGDPVPIFETDSFIRSVFLPAGRHTVRFSFVPVSFWTGVAVSLASVLIMALLWIIPLPRRSNP